MFNLNFANGLHNTGSSNSAGSQQPESHYDNNYAKLRMYNSYLANISILTMLTAYIGIFV